LQQKLLAFAPRVVCFNGKGVYAWYSRQQTVALGLQDATIGPARVFVMPSTSARNGRFSRAAKAQAFRALADVVAHQMGL
jgi:G:T/U-mismatch repair DNA glycosylase